MAERATIQPRGMQLFFLQGVTTSVRVETSNASHRISVEYNKEFSQVPP